MQCTGSILNLSHTSHFSSTRGKKYGCTWLCLMTRRYQYASLTLPCGQQTEAGIVKTSKEAILQNVAQNTPPPSVFKTAQWWSPLPSSNSADPHGLAFCSWNPAPAWVEGKAPAGLSRVGIARSKSLQCSIKLLGKVIGFRQCFCIICPFGHREHSRVSCASLHPAMQPMALFPCQQPNHHQHLRG